MQTILNILKEVIKSAKFIEIDHKYTFKEMTNLFYGMNLLKKFELPESLEKNFIADVMNKEGKVNLSHFADKSNYGKKPRAMTYYLGSSRSKLIVKNQKIHVMTSITKKDVITIVTDLNPIDKKMFDFMLKSWSNSVFYSQKQKFMKQIILLHFKNYIIYN